MWIERWLYLDNHLEKLLEIPISNSEKIYRESLRVAFRAILKPSQISLFIFIFSYPFNQDSLYNLLHSNRLVKSDSSYRE